MTTAGPAIPATQVHAPSAAQRRFRIFTKRRLAALFALAVVTLAIIVGYRTVTRPSAVGVAAAQVGTVQEEIIGPGSVQSRYSVSLGSRVTGTIDRVFVDVGDEVKKGELLATLDRKELEARYAVSRGAAASARQEVLFAKANLAKTRSDLDLARSKDRRARGLVAAGVASVAESDEASAAFTAAAANERAALTSIDARQAVLGRLAQEQRVAKTILSYTAIESPMAGIVTRRALEPGSTVAPGVVAFQIVDANALWVATLVDQSLAGRVELGQRAIIHLRSGAKLNGRVARIAFEADPVTREIEIDVAFDVRPARFAIHEEADVTILGAAAEGLVVPLAAIHHGPEGSSVFVVETATARRRPVRLGIVGADNAQVVEGLREGEAVILGPKSVRDGQRVAVARGAGG